jgi:hypothetical protein
LTDPRSNDQKRGLLVQDYVAHLLTIIDAAGPKLLAISEDDSAKRPGPGKWSPREIVGHLIDSASNNHQRFVRAQLQEQLVFPGYEQDAWVEVQRYQNARWRDLVALWAAFNGHIARIMAEAPEAVRTKPRREHNLHQLAWQPLPEDAPATLDYFMRDYVGHLEHHVTQILGPGWM